MSSFDHPTLIQHIGQQMTSLRKAQPEAMQGFGQLAKAAMAPGALDEKHKELIALAIRAAQHWEAGVTFAFIPKGTGVLLVPVPRLQTLKGIARGASSEGYRDQSDRI
jgi:alkylhydroperoxidase/carboxymuconolactone decarboxylase family protein YurZ